MKEVLIIFIILLVLLLMLSALGGCIRVKSDEHYDDDIPLYDESLLPPTLKPWESHPAFISDDVKSMSQMDSKSYPKMETESPVNAQYIEEEDYLEEDDYEYANDLEDDVVENEEDNLYEPVGEETMQCDYDKYEDISIQEAMNKTEPMYLSDPHKYDEESMKEVSPFSKGSDYAGI